MLKHSKVIIFSILLIGLLILSAHAGWCEGATSSASAIAADIPMKTDSMKLVLGKFAFTMGGVLVSLLVIWGGLSIIKEFKPQNKLISSGKKLYEEPKNPKTVDEAIVFFIRKNRLK